MDFVAEGNIGRGDALDAGRSVSRWVAVALVAIAPVVAKQLGLPPAKAAGPDEQKTYTRYAGPSEQQFGAPFVRRVIKDHEKDLVKYEGETRAQGMTPAYAKDVLPTRHRHLEIARALETVQTKVPGAARP